MELGFLRINEGFRMPSNRGFLASSVVFLIMGCFACTYLPYLASIAVFGPWTSIPLSIGLSRFGMFLQLIAGISAVPEVVGEEQLSKWYQRLQEVHLKAKAGKYRAGMFLFVLFLCISFLFWGLLELADGPNASFLILCILLPVGASFVLLTVAPDESTPPVLLSIALVRVLDWTIEQRSMRRLISRVSFPIFMSGIVSQLLSTFVP